MKRRIWIPIVVLVLASMACSLFGRAEEAIEMGKEAATRVADMATEVGEEGLATLVPEMSEEATPEQEAATEAPSEGEESEAEGDAEDAAPQIDTDALEGLDSYRARFSAEWVPEEGEGETFSFEEAHTRNPAAQRLAMEGMMEDESVEIVQIEDQSWMCTGGACTQMQADPEELASGFSDAALFNPGETLDDADTRFVGRETVNGVQTRHYELDLTAMETAFLAQGDVSDPSGEVWVADEPDLPQLAVRFVMSWTEIRDGVTGEAGFTYETYDINQPFTIEPPEGAGASGLPEDVPAYPNGEQTFSMEGMTSFETADPVADVAEFYRNGLAAEGWTAESDDDFDGLVQQQWTKDGRTLNVMVSEEDDVTSVIITIEG